MTHGGPGDSGPLEWLREGQRPDLLHIERVPLDAMRDWSFDFGTGNLRHRSGRFFSVGGLSVVTNYGAPREWMQPIIDQPEVGILGFLAAVSNGTLHFLVQRKVEPGNINVSQLSPTVQATHSNYTRVHGGGTPPYLDHFINPSRSAVIVDQLQMEQGARYRGKRNRHIIVRVDPDDVAVRPGYRWMRLDAIIGLAGTANALNLDTRTVLSCLPVALTGPEAAGSSAESTGDEFPSRLVRSLRAHCDEARLLAIDAWLERVQHRRRMTVRPIPLRSVSGWTHDGTVIAHESGRFFEVLGVSVLAPNREVPSWDQPLVRSCGRGIIGLLCQQREGELKFLARAILEPGEPEVRIGPTLQCIPDNHAVLPPFFDEIVHASDAQVRFRTIQSEEGGRFYHDERVLLVTEMPAGTALREPADYLWMTLRDIKEMIARYANVNIEMRSIVACLPLGV